MKKFLLILIAVALIALFTNPGPSKHKEAVKNKLDTMLLEATKEMDNEDNALGALLGNILGNAVINHVSTNNIIIKNYYVFSTTNYLKDGQWYVIGIGAFGNIFFTPEFKELVEEYTQQLPL